MKKLMAIVSFFLLTGEASPQTGKIDSLQEKLLDYYYSGNFNKALSYCDSLTPLIENTYGKDSKKYGLHLADNYAQVYEKMAEFGRGGFFKEAERYYTEGIEILRKSTGGLDKDYAEQLNNLGNMYTTLRLNYEAEKLLVKGISILKLIDSVYTETFASGLNNLGKVYTQMERFAEAEMLFDSALYYIGRLPETISMEDRKTFLCNVLNNKSGLYHFLGDYERAALYITAARDTMEKYKVQNPFLRLAVSGNMLATYIYAGKSVLAHEVITKQDKAYSAFSLKSLSYYRFLLNKIAYFNLKKMYDSSAIIYQEIGVQINENKTRDPELFYSWLIGYCTFSLANGRLARADSLQKLLTATNAEITNNLNYYTRFGMYSTLSYYHIATNNLVQARNYTDTLFEMVKTHFEKKFMYSSEVEKDELSGYIYECITRYLVIFNKTKNKDERSARNAYYTLAYYKNIILDSKQKFMQALKVSSSDSILSLFRQWQSSKRALSDEYKNERKKPNPVLDSISLLTDMLEKKMDLFAFRDAYIKDRFQPSEHYKKLGENEAIVEFVRLPHVVPNAHTFEAEYGCFITTSKTATPIWVYLGRESQILNILNLKNKFYLDQTTLPGIYPDPRSRSKNMVYPGDKLFHLIWAPLMKHLKKIDKVYCITQGVLSLLSLQSLPMNDREFIRDKYAIHYLLSSRSFLQSKNSEKVNNQNTRVSLWGGICYGKPMAVKETPVSQMLTRYSALSFDSLPGSSREIRSVSNILSRKNYYYSRDTSGNATDGNFYKIVSDSAQIILLSTHGFASLPDIMPASTIMTLITGQYSKKDNPLLTCGLAMANANEKKMSYQSSEDGILNGYEISLMNLNKTKLVVLSACETAIGPPTNAEGISGLQRAFKLAGVEKIIVSLWRINDRESARFMEYFFQQLMELNDISKAFMKTQHDMRTGTDTVDKMAPNGWGAFILIE